jgi:hypothetical protein
MIALAVVAILLGLVVVLLLVDVLDLRARVRAAERATELARLEAQEAFWDGWWNDKRIRAVVEQAGWDLVELPTTAVQLLDAVDNLPSNNCLAPDDLAASGLLRSADQDKLTLDRRDSLEQPVDVGVVDGPDASDDEVAKGGRDGVLAGDRDPADVVSGVAHESSLSVGRSAGGTAGVVGARALVTPGAGDPTVGDPTDSAPEPSAGVVSVGSPVGGGVPPASSPTDGAWWPVQKRELEQTAGRLVDLLGLTVDEVDRIEIQPAGIWADVTRDGEQISQHWPVTL